jgi:hypothetical protein
MCALFSRNLCEFSTSKQNAKLVKVKRRKGMIQRLCYDVGFEDSWSKLNLIKP